MSQNIHQDRILILDFGSQTTQLIARRVREIGVYCEVYPCTLAAQKIRDFKPSGIILSGGPASFNHQTSPRIPDVVFDCHCPVLGICYGMQAMAAQLGGNVHRSDKHEYGHAKLSIKQENPLFASTANELDVWMSHGDEVIALPTGFTCIANSNNANIAAIMDAKRQYYGIQFHPEVSHTPQGTQILKQFVLDICQCKHLWQPRQIIDDAVKMVQQHVGAETVILGLSGGVDSAVAAALLHKAIGKQLHCVFVDTGLLRANEQENVRNTFEKHFGMSLIVVDAREQFFAALAGVTDPEQKRKVIGKCFIDVFEEQSRQIKNAKWLAQGTIYPDVIESAGASAGQSHVIKSHHNVGGLPKDLNLKIIEPLRELFKDEVRQVGLELGLPHELVFRHPFPGPGLGVRILGEVKAEYAEILRKADQIFIETLQQSGWYEKVSQAFTVFLPVRSVGVIGDARSYDFVVSLRAVTTDDYMTAAWAQLPYELLATVSSRIINETSGISRVTYDISNKPPATIEWE